MYFEKVNPAHPDKVADRISGAITDLAYRIREDAIIATEVLIGHGKCSIIVETNVPLDEEDIKDIVYRIVTAPVRQIDVTIVKQDEELSKNQSDGIKCGDNGIFKGVPTSKTENILTAVARKLYSFFGTDGKYILNDEEVVDENDCGHLIICQSHATTEEIEDVLGDLPYKFSKITINPLGYWKGGTEVDSGATNRKLGSDMGRAVTGGGLCGKDYSKADVSLNIFAHLMAQESQEEINLYCAIGDDLVMVKGKKIPYSEIVEVVKRYINDIGGFESLAKWGLIRGF